MATSIDIQNAVVALIAGAGFTVKPRKVLQRLRDDGPNVCVVSLGGERLAHRTNMTLRGSYPVYVAIVRKGAQTVAKSDGYIEEARSTIFDVLHNPFLLGQGGVVRYCDYTSDPPFDRGKFADDDDVSVQLFTYHTEE